MTKKIPIGIQDFGELINWWYYYIDKTKSIYSLITSNKYYFLSRPRRFGKSLTLSTMKYLYMWKKELFKNTWIYNNWDFENTNPIIYMSFAGYTADQDIKEYISDNLKIFSDDKIFKLNDFTNKYNLSKLLEWIYKQTWKQIVVIIDEYDKWVLENITNIKVAEEMRRFFTGFYAWVKDNDMYIKLFMLTWLTKILKMSVFSVLNNLEDISYDPRVYNLMWYTEKEIETNFFDEIIEIWNFLKLEKNEVIEKIKINYNGYNFWNSQDTIYNPRNINNLILKKQFGYYWANTWIPSSVLEYVNKNQINVKNLVENINENKLYVNEVNFKLEDLSNINIPVLFTNAWYFTITKYENNEYLLWYPNKETESVMNNFFMNLIRPNYSYSLIKEISNWLYEWIVNLDKELLKETFDIMIYDFLWDTAYEWVNNNPEWWFKTFIWMFLRLNNMYYYPEVQNLKWRKDLVIPVNNKYYIIEAKVNKTTKEAIAQIDKKYMPQFNDWEEIVKVGFNWNKKNRTGVDVEFAW